MRNFVNQDQRVISLPTVQHQHLAEDNHISTHPLLRLQTQVGNASVTRKVQSLIPKSPIQNRVSRWINKPKVIASGERGYAELTNLKGQVGSANAAFLDCRWRVTQQTNWSDRIVLYANSGVDNTGTFNASTNGAFAEIEDVQEAANKGDDEERNFTSRRHFHDESDNARQTDSEMKLFERLMDRLIAELGDGQRKFKDVEVNLYTYKSPCISCGNVIQQFHDKIAQKIETYRDRPKAQIQIHINYISPYDDTTVLNTQIPYASVKA